MLTKDICPIYNMIMWLFTVLFETASYPCHYLSHIYVRTQVLSKSHNSCRSQDGIVLIKTTIVHIFIKPLSTVVINMRTFIHCI